MTTLPEDIAARIRHDFPAAAVESVVGLLAGLQREDPQLFGSRVLRCLVFLARGQLTKLAEWVTLARTDYRDLIVAAEYDENQQQVRDFNKPFNNVA